MYLGEDRTARDDFDPVKLTNQLLVSAPQDKTINGRCSIATDEYLLVLIIHKLGEKTRINVKMMDILENE